ncbi:MAG: twin transmembrane helix small protein [Woeseiaceae bacterium]|nr:twin transmembrane helix small protein [Woeseiaceae bacterium]
MKAIVLLLLAGIIISLGSGLFFLTKDNKEPGENSTRLLTSLKIRVALSIALIVVLVASFSFGWIQPPQ